MVAASPRPPLVLQLGRWRWPAAALVGLGLGTYVGVPLVGLIRQAGGDDWSVHRLTLELRRAATLQTGMILESLAWAAAAGVSA